MGELVAAQLLVVVDVPLLQHLLHPSQKLQIQMECLKWINRSLSGGVRLQEEFEFSINQCIFGIHSPPFQQSFGPPLQ